MPWVAGFPGVSGSLAWPGLPGEKKGAPFSVLVFFFVFPEESGVKVLTSDATADTLTVVSEKVNEKVEYPGTEWSRVSRLAAL